MIHCGECKRSFRSSASLRKVGWIRIQAGEHALMVVCVCKARIVAELLVDAATCCACARVVVGSVDDPLIVHPELGAYCGRCAVRAGVDGRPVDLLFRRWVETGDRHALDAFRARYGLPARAA